MVEACGSVKTMPPALSFGRCPMTVCGTKLISPEGDFFCWPCKAGREKGKVQCVICKGHEWRGENEQHKPAQTDKWALL